MKAARFILKIVAICLSAAAAACCIIAYWDKICNLCRALGDKFGIEVEVNRDDEFDDYADWED